MAPGFRCPKGNKSARIAFREVGANWEIPKMTLGTILLIILILALVGAIPSWPYSRGWGYGPSGAVGVVVVILLILVLTNRL
jgi:uncharacterized protein DUF3309